MDMNMKKIKESDLEIKPFRGATFQQFQKFLDSLEDEKKTWSLDLKDKNLKEYFLSYCENGLGLLAVLDEEVVGIVNSYLIFDNTNNIIKIIKMQLKSQYVLKKEFRKGA